MVTCSVRDPKYTDALESLFQRNDLLAFTVQSLRDFKTLSAQTSRIMNLHDVTIKTCSSTLEEASQRPFDFDLAAYGFDGWALDYLSGPDRVLAMLCNDNRLHMTPLRLRDISNPEYETLVNLRLAVWVAGRNYYKISRRREYGPGAVSTQVRLLQAAKIWTNQPVDVAVKRDLQDTIAGWTEEHAELERQIDANKATYANLKPRAEVIQRERVRFSSLMSH
jgi:hypothetical protein